MDIEVFGAVGSAPTSLAAFDRALQSGGVHDLNLITLSSVIPPACAVVRKKPDVSSAEIGDRLFCVMAREEAIEPGAEAWACIGWALDAEGRGGVFVETHGRSEHEVRSEAESALATLVTDRPYLDLAEQDFHLAGGVCVDEPICAIVLASYETASWRTT